jgi:8-oxo-dGTP pyrophosphatase MutT (NUDIX family)
MRRWDEQNKQIGSLIAICVVEGEEDGTYFMGKRIKPPENAWEFPGGKVDPFDEQGNVKDTCILDGALRELTEEVADKDNPPQLELKGILGRGLPHYVFFANDPQKRTQRVFRTINFHFKLKSGKLMCGNDHHAAGWLYFEELACSFNNIPLEAIKDFRLAESAQTALTQLARKDRENEPCSRASQTSTLVVNYPNHEDVFCKQTNQIVRMPIIHPDSPYYKDFVKTKRDASGIVDVIPTVLTNYYDRFDLQGRAACLMDNHFGLIEAQHVALHEKLSEKKKLAIDLREIEFFQKLASQRPQPVRTY